MAVMNLRCYEYAYTSQIKLSHTLCMLMCVLTQETMLQYDQSFLIASYFTDHKLMHEKALKKSVPYKPSCYRAKYVIVVYFDIGSTCLGQEGQTNAWVQLVRTNYDIHLSLAVFFSVSEHHSTPDGFEELDEVSWKLYSIFQVNVRACV